MEITKEQIKKLHQMSGSSAFERVIMEMFPEAFEPELACNSTYNDLVCDIWLNKVSQEMGLIKESIVATIPTRVNKDIYGFGLNKLYDWKLIEKDEHKFLIPYKR